VDTLQKERNAPLLIERFPMVPRAWQEAPWFGINEWARWMNETFGEWMMKWMNEELNEQVNEHVKEWMNEGWN